MLVVQCQLPIQTNTKVLTNASQDSNNKEEEKNNLDSTVFETNTIHNSDSNIENVVNFQYLGRAITATRTDNLMIERNIWKACKVWQHTPTIRWQKGAYATITGNF
jgi:hypothetical protein